MDGRNRACSILGEAKSPDSTLPWMRTLIDDDFYRMAETWLETIGGSYCLAISDRRDLEYLRERNPVWYQSMNAAGIESLVIFPLFSQEQLPVQHEPRDPDAHERHHRARQAGAAGRGPERRDAGVP